MPTLATAETRPHYGGTLVVETHETMVLPDPASLPVQFVPLVYEGLIKLDREGNPRPALAVSWEHDSSGTRWVFHLRTGVNFHDGSALTAASIVACLKDWNHASAVSDTEVAFQTESPVQDLPVQLAAASRSILQRGPDAVTVGTGPFRIAEWQPGKRALLAANENYWGSRPYVDFVEIRMGRAYRDQAIDLEMERAFIVEVAIEDLRRLTPRGLRIWTSAPGELMALVFERERPALDDANLRQAVALAIDRAAIHSVLLQRQGAPAGALLPQWLSGYAFLFPAGRDLDRSRQILPKQPPARFSVAYDPADPLARPIVERIALNAHDAGITIQVLAATKADARLVRMRLGSLNPGQALTEFAAAFDIPRFQRPTSPDSAALFAAEQELLRDGRVIPLFHIPQILGLSPQLRNWDPQPWGDWRLDNVWLEPKRP